jgi:NAD(P)-dependent dehydrogenase (short-subunit alcohol dehydrogenase family)
VGDHDDLLTVSLDVTDVEAVAAAIQAAQDRFGRIDVLVNNAGTFQAGPFEEVTDEQFRAQMETNFFGVLNVTRAVLPVMRRQRSGHVVTITSTAGIVTGGGGSAYAASKFALEGWMEALREEIAPFGIRATTVEPGFFRTELLVEGASTLWPGLSIDDYAASTADIQRFFRSMHRNQAGDPAKLAANLVTVVGLKDAPARWVAGADAVEQIEQKGRTLVEQANAHLALSTGLDVAG